MTPTVDTGIVTVDLSVCRQCAACEIICPNQVFHWRKGEIETRFAGRCIRCGHCVAVCPEGALTHAALDKERFERIDPFEEMSFNRLTRFLKSRRSCRRFKEKPILPRKIDALLETARFAPSATNSQNVRFIVMDQHASIAAFERCIAAYYLKLKRQLDNPVSRWLLQLIIGRRLVQAYRFHLPGIADRFQSVLDGTGHLFYHAPVVVLAYASGLPHIAAANCNLAVMEILLTAESMGLATCYNGYALTAVIRDKQCRKFSTLPKGYTPGAALAIGEPATVYHRVPPRRNPRITRI